MQCVLCVPCVCDVHAVFVSVCGVCTRVWVCVCVRGCARRVCVCVCGGAVCVWCVRRGYVVCVVCAVFVCDVHAVLCVCV